MKDGSFPFELGSNKRNSPSHKIITNMHILLLQRIKTEFLNPTIWNLELFLDIRVVKTINERLYRRTDCIIDEPTAL